MDQSCEKEEVHVLHRVKEERNMMHRVKRRKDIWIGHILHGDCLLSHGIEGKTQEEMTVTRRQGRRRKHLLDDVKETRGYCKLKE